MPKAATLIVRAIAPDDWDVIVRLFGSRGACGGCWCMHWRVSKGGRDWEAATKAGKNRERFRRLVRAGRVHGVAAFEGEEPVGWCSFGPRGDFPRLLRARSFERERTVEPWAIVCFYIPRPWQGRGLATRLLNAASEVAFARGAPEVEGYPVNTRPGARLPAPFAWTGVREIFEAAGYRKLPRPGIARDIYVKRNPASP